MALSKTAISLLSCLRRTGSTSALSEIPEDFFNAEEKVAFNWLKSYVREHKQFPTPKTFKKNINESTVVTKEPLSYYIQEARKRALYMGILEPFGQIRELLQDRKPDDVVEIAKEIIELSHRLDGGRTTGLVNFDDALDLVLRDEEEAFNTVGLRGVTTGWPELDSVTDGHQNGDLNSLVGRPGRGKTYLLLKAANAARREGRSALVVSMEMNAMPMARRIIGIEKGYNPDFMRKGTFSTVIRRRFKDAVQEMKGGVPFWFISGNFRKSVPAVRAIAEEVHPDIVYVDASYLLQPEKKRYGSGGRRESVSDTVEELKQIGLDINRPVIQTVQFNRQAVRSRRSKGLEQSEKYNPIAHLSLEKIGETDVVGQASSVVFGLELHASDNEKRYMGILKGREGEIGHWVINYKFNPVNFDVYYDNYEATQSEGEQDSPEVDHRLDEDLDWVDNE